jgi:excisionase family DNA binding protein
MLGVSPRTIQNYVAARVLPSRKIGRRTLIPVRALEAFLRSDHKSPFKRQDTPDRAVHISASVPAREERR